MAIEASHVSAAELAAQLGNTTDENISPRVRHHVASCERCRYLLALARRSHGNPGDEASEVLLERLRAWVDA